MDLDIVSPEVEGESTYYDSPSDSSEAIAIKNQSSESSQQLQIMFKDKLKIDTSKEYMTLRVTHDSINKKAMNDFFLECEYNHWIISQEGKEKSLHLHILLISTIEVLGTKYKKFRQKLTSKWPYLSGNGSYSISTMKDDSYISYIMKEDKNPLYCGFTDLQIKCYKEKSYAKYTKESFAKEYDDIRYDKKLPADIKLYKYIELKVKFSQTWTTAQLDSHYQFFLAQEGSKNIKELVEATKNKHLRNVSFFS